MATEFSRTLSMLRREQGLSQRKVAAELGISQAQISRIEKNALKTMRHYLSPEK